MRQSIVLVCLLMLAACSGGMYFPPTPAGPTVTPNPNASPTFTPFGPQAEPTTVHVPLPAATEPETPTAASTLSPSSSTPFPALQLPLYTLDVTLDYMSHHALVDEVILYQNNTNQTLSSFVLAVEPNLWLDCFILADLTIDGAKEPDYTLDRDRLEIPLSYPLSPQAIANLSFHYDLDLPEADPYHVFGYNAYQINLVDWYPFIVPYSDGWLLHPPGEVGEHLVYDEADFDVTVTLVSTSQSITLAASSPGDANGMTWHYSLSQARTFALSASTSSQSVSTTVDGLVITSYFFEADKIQAQTVLDEVAKAVTTFNDLFGPDPYPSLSIVESPFYDGMEYDGLFFLSHNFYARDDGTVLNDLIDIAVHETAHQWWFGLVGSDQAMEPWLDEALATYSELLFYKQNYPEVSSWWSFRVDSYAPTGWVDTDIYHGANFRTYANAVYLRGAQFLDAIRNRVGEDAFLAFLKDYAIQMAGKRSTPDDFFRILSLHTTVDYSDIINNFFQRKY
jgi:hypothetical protein